MYISSAGPDKAIGCFDAAVQVCFTHPKIMWMVLHAFFCAYFLNILLKKKILCHKYEIKTKINVKKWWRA